MHFSTQCRLGCESRIARRFNRRPVYILTLITADRLVARPICNFLRLWRMRARLPPVYKHRRLRQDSSLDRHRPAAIRVLRTTDRGRTWQVADTPLASGPSAGIFSIAFRDAKHGVIAGGDYRKESEAVDNLAVTNDGGSTWTLVKGLSGFRSVVAYVPGAKTPTLVALGPSGGDYSTDDGKTWTSITGPGCDTFSFVPRKSTGWGAGANGSIGRLTFEN